jgi:hypothetical protein
MSRPRPARVLCRERLQLLGADLSADSRQDEGDHFRRPPTGPRVAPPRKPTAQPAARSPRSIRNKRHLISAAFFALLIAGIGIRAYRDLSRPEAWAYWKELYFSPSMTSSLLASTGLDGPGRGRPALFISGTIGAASASWLRERLDQAGLSAGDTVWISSSGGNLNQAIIMGEIIRSRGLATAIGMVGASGQIRPSYCASACVFVYAGGKPRFGVEGSRLGVHRFVTPTPGRDPVAETQRIGGMILSYMTRMGISSSVVEAMSETREIRWLDANEAVAMNLVTNPAAKP